MTFIEDGNPIGTATLDTTGNAVLITTPLQPATLTTIVAQYSGDPDDAPSASAPLGESVAQIPTTTTLTASANPTYLGQSMTFTAVVAPLPSGLPEPTGSVTFYDGATMLAIVALTGTDTASYSASTLAVGVHPVSAVYSGDANDAGSTSSILNQVVSPDNTQVALTVSNTAPVVGQKVTLKATVSVLPPGAGPATGSATFFEGSTELGTAALSSGVASLLAPFPLAGPGSVTAVYSGNAADATSTSAGVSISVGVDTTKTVLAVAPAAPVVGQTVILKATVAAAAPGVGTPTGSVRFYDEGTTIGVVALTGTTASLPMTYGSPGSHSFTAVYTGDANDSGSSTATASTLMVNPDTTRTTLAVTTATPVVGQTVTLKATVSVVGGGVGTPTGLVTFYDEGTSIGAVALTGTTASLPMTYASPGSHLFTAIYSGDANDNGSSTATASSVTVNPDTTKTVVNFSVLPAVLGQSVTITATVSAVAPGAGTPSSLDSVEFWDGAPNVGTDLGPGTSIGGSEWTLTTSSLVVATHPIQAVYTGDPYDLTSTSKATKLVVNKDATTTALVSSASPTVFGQSVTFTATVSATSPGFGAPTGMVTFKNGSTTLGTGTLSGGVATFTTSALSVASHSITAVYGGDTNDLASTSTATNQVVNKDATTTALASSANPSVFGQSVTFTATVTASSPGVGTPTGTVTFKDGSTTLGIGTLRGGLAIFTTSSLSVATHSITAVYSGDTNDLTSTSTAVDQVVNLVATTAALTSSNLSGAAGTVTYSATVADVAPGTGTPTGTVTFYDSAGLIGMATLVGGVAKLKPSAQVLAPGSYLIYAIYSGDATHQGFITSTITQVLS